MDNNFLFYIFTSLGQISQTKNKLLSQANKILDYYAWLTSYKYNRHIKELICNNIYVAPGDIIHTTFVTNPFFFVSFGENFIKFI